MKKKCGRSGRGRQTGWLREVGLGMERIETKLGLWQQVHRDRLDLVQLKDKEQDEVRNAGWEWRSNENEAEMKSQEQRRGSSESGLSVVGWSRRTQALEGGNRKAYACSKTLPLKA